MTAKRSQLELANSLEPFTGPFVSQYLFGFGVLAMAISTIVILMLINGFAFCEALGVEHSGANHRIGCLIAGIVGFFGPIIWANHGPWLAIPTSVAGYSMLPIAAFAFLFLLNSKSLLGEDKPSGGRLIKWNLLMGISTIVAALGSCWASYGKISGWAVKKGMSESIGWAGPRPDRDLRHRHGPHLAWGWEGDELIRRPGMTREWCRGLMPPYQLLGRGFSIPPERRRERVPSEGGTFDPGGKFAHADEGC